MPAQKTQAEPGYEEAFLEDLLQILLKSYGGENPAVDDRQRLLDILALNAEYLERSGADANFCAL